MFCERIGIHRRRFYGPDPPPRACHTIVWAGSWGRRNDCLESIGWCLEAKGLSWARVEAKRYGVEVGLRVATQVDAFGQVLPHEAVGVLVGSALPWRRGITEVDGDIGRDAEPSVFREFGATVPGQARAQLPRKRLDVSREGVGDLDAVF